MITAVAVVPKFLPVMVMTVPPSVGSASKSSPMLETDEIDGGVYESVAVDGGLQTAPPTVKLAVWSIPVPSVELQRIVLGSDTIRQRVELYVMACRVGTSRGGRWGGGRV